MQSPNPGLNCRNPSKLRRRRAIERDGGCCVWCGGSASLTVHHIWPHRISHDDRVVNLITLCGPCHARVELFGKYAAAWALLLVYGPVLWLLRATRPLRVHTKEVEPCQRAPHSNASVPSASAASAR